MANTKITQVIDFYVAELNNPKRQKNMLNDRRLYTVRNGRRYAKVVMSNHNGSSASVFAFIDRNTGDVFKPATWNSPAKHVRFTVRNKSEALSLAAVSEYTGGFLYMR